MIRLITSPGAGYLAEIAAALAGASRFVLVTGFASVGGLEVIAPALRSVLSAGGQGRIVVAVDRQGFNASSMFEALLALKADYPVQLSLGVALETAGLMHAKALYTETPRGPQLLVGSANLTRSALGVNHELGVLLGDSPSDINRAFHQFVTSIAPRSLDGADAQAFLLSLGLLARKRRTAHVEPRPDTRSALSKAFGRLGPLEPLAATAEEHIGTWIRRGYMVGRGRRSLDALVLRLPQETLVRHGLIRAPKREALGVASHESRSTGYGIDLIPSANAEALRKDARRVSFLIAKLTLNLPCFGLWMPESYWETFVDARATLEEAESLLPENVRELAAHHAKYLKDGGLDGEVESILARLEALDILVPGKQAEVREFVVPRFRRELALRTPEVLAGCVEFRTARQRWTPFDQTEAPYRQLMVDVLQATFASTYRSGDWPRRFGSHAARRIAEAIEAKFTSGDIRADSEAALAILDQLTTWERDDRPMTDVVTEFRQLVDDDLSFPSPDLGSLQIGVSGTLDDDDGGAEDVV